MKANLTPVEQGYLAETLVLYKLLRWGENAMLVNAVTDYDIVVMKDRPLRIQVKSTYHTVKGENTYQFKTKHGSRNARRLYCPDSYDMFCFVALDIERVLFQPHVEQYTKRIKDHQFNSESEHKSYFALVDNLSRG